jgi:hypothetical protein
MRTYVCFGVICDNFFNMLSYLGMVNKAYFPNGLDQRCYQHLCN